MCPYHNIHKDNRRVALSEYREEIAANGELTVDSVDDLISLTQALAQANVIYGDPTPDRTHNAGCFSRTAPLYDWKASARGGRTN